MNVSIGCLQLIGYTDTDNFVHLKEHECFIGCAKELVLSGKKLAEMCKHNAFVSRKHGKHNATTLWNFLEICYGSNEMNTQNYEHRNSFSNQKNAQNVRRTAQVVNNSDASKWEHNKSNIVDGSDDNLDIKSQDDDHLLDGSGSSNKQTYPPCGSVILSETQILSEVTFDNFDSLRNGFLYVGPPDFTKALALPETALHCDVQAARPQLDIKTKNREKSPV